MGLQDVQTEIGFADGEIIQLERIGNAVVVFVKAWNEKEVRVEFDEVYAVRDFAAGDLSGLFVHDGETEFVKQALAYGYEKPPTTHELKHFVFKNPNDEACLEIIATAVRIRLG